MTKACDVILQIFTTLTPEQQADVSLFQKVCPNKENKGSWGRDGGSLGGTLKEDGSWLIYDDYTVLAIGIWNRPWKLKCGYEDYSLKERPPLQLSSDMWRNVEVFHSRIVYISKHDSGPFELKLKSGLSIFIAPRIP